MFCARCGAENADNKTLCKRCRQPLAIVPAVLAASWSVALRRRSR